MATTGRARRILVVDDDPSLIRMTTAILESRGYQVSSAQDGEQALAMVRDRPPDVVLLDVMMNWVLEGAGVCHEMMKDPYLRGIPIIMLTAIRNSEYGGMFPRDQYLHIDSWLDKPCPPDKLIAEIEATLARRTKFEENSEV